VWLNARVDFPAPDGDRRYQQMEHHKLTPPHPFEGADRTIHIWSVRTTAPDAIVSEFQSLVSPDEQTQATRFCFTHLRSSFVLARGALRLLLGAYLDAAPTGIQLLRGPKGKPSLPAPARIQFNTSHSGALATFGFALDCEIGVDVEHFRPIPDMQEIASRFFSEEEASEIISVPASEREHAFFLCWTRKEAYIKAIGLGLSTPLDGFVVSVRPDERARLIHVAHDIKAASAWTLTSLDLGPQYVAAIAYRDAPRPLQVSPVLDPGQLLATLRG
jgi:4'-phosphopantetheinyl transferase